MKLRKILIIFTFLLAFALQVSAQDKSPKIVWKNLQEKFERFEDIKPIIVNESEVSVYMFSDIYSGIVHDFLELYQFSENSKGWFYVLHHGHPVKEEYVRNLMSSSELKPQEQAPFIIDSGGWLELTEDRGILFDFINTPNKGKGKYKFQLKFY